MRLCRALVFAGVPALALSWGCAREEPLNVVLIVVDTLRADHLGLYGYERPTSPHLDDWASKGAVFEQAFATSSWTLPSFGSILTGLGPARHGAGGRLETEGRRWKRSPLDPDLSTVPEVLQRAGYATAAIVSNPFLREQFGTAKGFESYDYDRGRNADRAVTLALDWLRERGDSPFFLMLHLIDPHLPYAAPGEFQGRFTPPSVEAGSELPGLHEIRKRINELTTAEKSLITDRYDEELAFVDREIDKFFSWLLDSGVWERTLVILTSDHGEELFDHGGFEHGHTMYQELLRVPLIVWGPDIRPQRQLQTVSIIDLAPTIYAAARCKSEVELEGVSLWGVLRQQESLAPRQIYGQSTLWVSEQKAIVAWPYKLILAEQNGWKRLFDLAADPAERADLAPMETELVDHLQSLLSEQLVGAGSDRTRAAVTLSPEIEAELRSLGYLD